MATRFQVTFDCADPACLAGFWADALGYRIPDPPDGHASWEDWLRSMGVPEDEWNSANAVEDPDGEGPRLYFQRVPEAKVAKNRVHLDLNVSGGHAVPLEERRIRVDAEVRRLVSLGASDARGAKEERGEVSLERRNGLGGSMGTVSSESSNARSGRCPDQPVTSAMRSPGESWCRALPATYSS